MFEIKSLTYATLALVVLSVASVQGHVKATNSSNPANDLGIALRTFMDSFQRVMPCGFEAMGIPVLAPFHCPFYKVNVSTENVILNGYMANLFVSGLNKFRLLDSSYNATTQRFRYDMIFPEIQLLADKNFSVWFLFAGIPISFRAEGYSNVKFEDVRFISDFDIVENPESKNGSLIMHIYDMKFVFGNVRSHSWNTRWDIAFNNFINKWLGEALEMFDAQAQRILRHLYEENVVKQQNEGLAKINMTELVEMYFGLADAFDSVNCQLSGNLV